MAWWSSLRAPNILSHILTTEYEIHKLELIVSWSFLWAIIIIASFHKQKLLTLVLLKYSNANMCREKLTMKKYDDDDDDRERKKSEKKANVSSNRNYAILRSADIFLRWEILNVTNECVAFNRSCRSKRKKNQRWEECWWERNMMRFRALAPSFCSTHTNQYMHIKGTSADFDSICHIHIHMHDGDLVSFSIRSLSHRIRSHTFAYIVHNQPNQHSTHILTRRTIMHEYCIETESLDSQSHAHKHSGTVIVDDRFVFILFIAWSFAMNAIHLARTKHFVHLDQQISTNNFCSIPWKWSINMQRFQSACQFQVNANVSCVRAPFVLFVQFVFKTCLFWFVTLKINFSSGLYSACDHFYAVRCSLFSVRCSLFAVLCSL